MTNNIVSYGLPYDPVLTELQGGQALAFKTISGELALTKFSATDTDYAGSYYGSNGSQVVSLAQGGIGTKIAYVSTGMSIVPVNGAVVAGALLYADATTGFYTSTLPTSGYVKVVGVALSPATASGDYIRAELIKSI